METDKNEGQDMELHISYTSGKQMIASCRGHKVVIDQPTESGGADEGMTPPELFVSALGSCIGVYIINYCQNVGLNVAGMTITSSYEKAKDPARIGKTAFEITLPNTTLGARRAAVMKVAESCLIHNTISHAPEINISICGQEDC